MDHPKSQKELRALVSILFVVAVLFQSSVRTFVAVGYYVNKQFIAANLCENKAIANMHCNGKCYLKKQLNNATEKEQSIPDVFKKQTEWMTRAEITGINLCIPELEKSLFQPYISGYSYLIPSGVFHPPCDKV